MIPIVLARPMVDIPLFLPPICLGVVERKALELCVHVGGKTQDHQQKVGRQVGGRNRISPQ